MPPVTSFADFELAPDPCMAVSNWEQPLQWACDEFGIAVVAVHLEVNQRTILRWLKHPFKQPTYVQYGVLYKLHFIRPRLEQLRRFERDPIPVQATA